MMKKGDEFDRSDINGQIAANRLEYSKTASENLKALDRKTSL